MKTVWLQEALVGGMTANAFKLGTVMTGGWFWVRVGGCAVLYRGLNMEAIDFGRILSVGALDADIISPPSYVQHNNDTTYFYVVRRANSIGCQEHTLSAAAKISIDANGDLLPPQPNSIFGAKAKQVAGNKVRLVWHYCPIEQKS